MQLGPSQSLLSPAYMTQQTLSCLMLLRHFIVMALALALESAGSSIAAKMAMMAITTSSSIKVKPARRAKWRSWEASCLDITSQPFAPLTLRSTFTWLRNVQDSGLPVKDMI